MNRDGSNQRPLTRIPPLTSTFSWSPDGRSIAFFGDSGISIVDVERGKVRSLRTPGCAGFCVEDREVPSWSPDSQKIAFSGDSGTGPPGSWSSNGEIYIIDADGGQEHQLTRTSNGSYLPAWSPNANKILFKAIQSSNHRGDRFQVQVINPDGRNRRSLTSNRGEIHNLGWSPDGRRIALFASQNVADKIYVINADGSKKHLVSGNPSEGSELAWSPDGRKIAFESEVAKDHWEILVTGSDGSGKRQLTRSPQGSAGGSATPSWSPDGRLIAFTRLGLRTGKVAAIYVMNSDGSAQRRLTK